MLLSEALSKSKDGGWSIRNSDHGLQALVPTGDSFVLTGTCDPPYNFTSTDWIRDDWECVGLTPTKNFAPNFVLESQFVPDGAVPIETPTIYQEETKETVKKKAKS